MKKVVRFWVLVGFLDLDLDFGGLDGCVFLLLEGLVVGILGFIFFVRTSWRRMWKDRESQSTFKLFSLIYCVKKCYVKFFMC